MGYTTWFDGGLKFNKPVTEELMDRVNDFAEERHDPKTHPGYYCQWVIEDEELIWDGNEKFYEYDRWLDYLIDNFFKPEGYILNGIISFQGEDSEDFGEIQVVDNVVTMVFGIHAQTLGEVGDEDLIAECKRRGLM